MVEKPSSTTPSVIQCLVATFDVIAGRIKVHEAYDFSERSFWQVVLSSWGLGLLLFIPFAGLGIEIFFRFAASSFVSLLTYALLIWHILVWSQRAERFLNFIIPFYWLNALQIVLFGLVTLITQMTGLLLVQLAIVPLAIWVLLWQFRIARDQLLFSTIAAICIVFARFCVEFTIGMFGNIQMGAG